MGLSRQFLAHTGAVHGSLADEPELESTLSGLTEAARSAWPDLSVPMEVFLRHLAERLPTRGDPLEALRGLHAADLYLACACACGDPKALRHFEDRFLRRITGYLERQDALPAFSDDVKQALRVRLLVGAEGFLPKIASYTGQGPLATWLRIAAARLASNLRRAQKEQASVEADKPVLIRSPSPDPELAYLRTRYGNELEASFRETVEALAPRERIVLRLHYLDGMTAQAIAAVLRVSSRTVERWIARTRERIVKQTRRRLGQRLRLQPSQLNTLLALVQSQVDLDLATILKSADPDPE